VAAPVDPVRAIADAVLYEGYVLWPYRRSALKNQKRWTFGGVYPRAHSEGREDDPWSMQTQCLLEASADTRVEVSVRFLHVVERQVARVTPEGDLEPVDELTVAGERHLSWSEATEREIAVRPLSLEELTGGYTAAIEVAAASREEPLADEAGERGTAYIYGEAPDGATRARATLGADVREAAVAGGVYLVVWFRAPADVPTPTLVAFEVGGRWTPAGPLP